MIGIGIDIGGTGIKAGTLDEEGRAGALASTETPAEAEPAALVESLASLVARLQEQTGEGIGSLGVGCAGLVTPDLGIVRTSPNLPRWENVPLAEMILDRVGRRPVVLNDANAFALAEARLGAARGASSMVGLTLGTGVGGGIILGGRLWAGLHGYAGELGHVPLVADGPLCACGARGCLEALVGTRALLRRYRELSGRDDEEDLTPFVLSERARAGDAAARDTFRETGRLLGLALGGIVHTLDPEVLVIGGGIAGSADLILPDARKAMTGAILLPAALAPPVVPAALGNAAGWMGAALAALEKA